MINKKRKTKNEKCKFFISDADEILKIKCECGHPIIAHQCKLKKRKKKKIFALFHNPFTETPTAFWKLLVKNKTETKFLIKNLKNDKNNRIKQC